MCPIYGYPGVIWTVLAGMCYYRWLYHSPCIYYVLLLYYIFAIHYYYCLYYFLSSLYTISSSCFRTHRSFRHTRTIELYGIGLSCNLLIELYIKYNKKISYYQIFYQKCYNGLSLYNILSNNTLSLYTSTSGLGWVQPLRTVVRVVKFPI